MGRRSETGGVAPLGDRIQVRFTWKGNDLRPTLALKPNAANLAHARRLRASIVREIADGTFDLARHFPTYRFKAKHEPEGSPGARTLKDWAETYKALMGRGLEHSSLDVYMRHLRAYWLSAWGDLPPQRVTHEMVLRRLATLSQDELDTTTGQVRKALGRKTQNNIMIPLRGVFALACKALAIPDPTEGIDNLKVQRAEPDPFSIEEVEVVLAELLRTEGPEVADWFEFAFFAGLRSSEQVALKWANVDLRSGTFVVREAQVLGKAKDRTKTHRQRTVEMNDRAAAVIARQRPRTQLQPHGHVFATAGLPGKPWRDEQLQWRAWNRALRLSGVRYRAPKECRDTSVTMALQAGASPVWVAAQHGHSLTVMMRDYAKWIPQADRGRNLAAVNVALQAAGEENNQSTTAAT